ncbi:MAG TPA: universal stress protein [Gaiellales bacterium]|nr:universal stress protein [Gaiellales bacterium]
MSTILIATDGSDPARAAAETGLDLARCLGDRVVFVAVWHPVYTSTFGVPPTYFGPDVVEAERQWAEEALAHAAEQATAAGVDAETVLLEGSPAVEICRYAADHQVRMIVIGSHGWGAFRSIVSRSTVTGVLAHAPCPVLSGTPVGVTDVHAEAERQTA